VLKRSLGDGEENPIVAAETRVSKSVSATSERITIGAETKHTTPQGVCVSSPRSSRSPWGRRQFADNPMDQDIERRLENLKRAPRCGALTRSGGECQRPAIRGRGRCRLHGGLSPWRAARYEKRQFPQWELDDGSHRGAQVAAFVSAGVCLKGTSQ
jgi:hypothetical protein